MRLSAAPRWCGGHHPVGDAEAGPIRLSFNPQLRVEFRGATVTSDAGLLLPRELDEHLGLGALIERHLSDPRTGRNSQFPLPDLFRQSIYSRLAGYEDTNDAERLAEDPTFRMLASRERREISVALTSTLHWFETDVLADEENDQGLSRLNTDLLQHEATRSPTRPRGRPSHAPLVRYRSVQYQAASWDRPRRVIAKVEHHLGELFPRVGHRHDPDWDEPGRGPLLQPTWDGGAVDQGGQRSHPL